MTWVKLDDAFATHPKIVPIGPHALALHIWGLCFSARHLTDGFVSIADLSGFPWVSKRSALIRDLGRLEDAGLWRAVEGGYVIHDYLDYNPSAAQVKQKRAASAARQARLRRRRSKPRHVSSNGVTQEWSNAVSHTSPVPEGDALTGRSPSSGGDALGGSPPVFDPHAHERRVAELVEAAD